MIVRYLSAAGLGFAVTAVLLWSMQYLVEMTATGHEPSAVPTYDWFRAVRKESELTTKEPMPKPIDRPVAQPPLRPVSEHGEVTNVTGIPIDPGIPTWRKFSPRILGPADSELVAIVQVRPEYPINAIHRGIEGFVDVVFDVTEAGTVTNAVAVASSHSIFEKAAVRAAERFRYRARMQDGVPQATSGVRKRFRFEMKD